MWLHNRMVGPNRYLERTHPALTAIGPRKQRRTFSFPKDAGSQAHQYVTGLAADR
jgi:hypothetical protein